MLIITRDEFAILGPPQAGVSTNSNNQQVVGQGIFASSSLATLRMRKEIELWELCHTTLPKVPRAYSKVCQIKNCIIW